MKIKKILAFVCAVSVSMAGFVQNFEGNSVSNIVDAADNVTKDGLVYIVNSDGMVEITKYEGTDTKVVIPETIDGKKVIEIGTNAFSNCEDITEIILPDTIINIGSCAFWQCKKLTSINLPDSIQRIGIGAFYACAELTKVTLPKNLTAINSELFSRCYSLSEINIPDHVNYIGRYAFNECKNLAKISIPDKVSRIEDFAFYSCKNLSEVTIPESVTDIGKEVFYDTAWQNNLLDTLPGACVAVNNMLIAAKDTEVVKVPDGVTFIGKSTFENLKNVKEVYFSESVKTIDESAFNGCTGLTKITLNDGLEKIENSAFYKCENLAEIKIPDTVTSIGNDAFSNCSKLTEITIPKGVETLNSSTFALCTNLSSVKFHDNFKCIGEGAFLWCNSLAEITIPDSVTSIKGQAFGLCPSLTKIIIPASVTTIDDTAFEKSSKIVIYGYENSYAQKYAAEKNIKFVVIGNASDEPGKTEDDKHEYQEKDGITYSVSDKDTVEIAKYTGSDTKIVIPEKIDGKTVTSINRGAFEGCTDVSEISIPETVDYIGYNAFTGTKWLEEQKKVIPLYPAATVNHILIDAKALGEIFTHIGIQDDTLSIAGGAFENCTDVKEVDIPDSVTFIGEKAFNNCTGMTKITVPDSVTTIEKDAFAGCTKLVIYGNKKSYIEKYASENKIRFEVIPEPVKGSGDINSDGKLDVSDVLTVKKWFIGSIELTDAQKAAMDLNDDGKLNIADMCLLKEKLLSDN